MHIPQYLLMPADSLSHLPDQLPCDCCNLNTMLQVSDNHASALCTHLRLVGCSSQIVLVIARGYHETPPIHKPQLICRVPWSHVLCLEISIHHYRPGVLPATWEINPGILVKLNTMTYWDKSTSLLGMLTSGCGHTRQKSLEDGLTPTSSTPCHFISLSNCHILETWSSSQYLSYEGNECGVMYCQCTYRYKVWKGIGCISSKLAIVVHARGSTFDIIPDEVI